MADRIASLPFIERLIGFDTTSRNSNLALIDWVRDYFDGFGITSRLTFDDEGRKANLFASIGPEHERGFILSGHTDTVPVDGQAWTGDPFSVREQDGRLIGRGTSDMKSFIAVALSMVPHFVERRLKHPIQFALTYDEEVGCRGAPGLIKDLETLPLRPLGCIVGEPTGMGVIDGHKGKMAVRCHVHGKECHSALAPSGVNAINYASELILFLRDMMRRRAAEGPFDHKFDPPYTTIHSGTIRGGTALNIVPKDCSFEFEFRTLPSEQAEDLLAVVERFVAEKLVPEMRAKAPHSGFVFERMSAFPGLVTASDAEIAVLVKSIAGVTETGKVSYGTEGGLFDGAGIPAVICGPGHIREAHRPDEWVEVSQISACEAFMHRFADRLSLV